MLDERYTMGSWSFIYSLGHHSPPGRQRLQRMSRGYIRPIKGKTRPYPPEEQDWDRRA